MKRLSILSPACLKLAFALALGACLPAAALAAETEPRWSVSALGGYGTLGDSSFGGSAGASGTATFDAGFMAGLAVSYRLGAWELGGDYLYQTNDLDRPPVGGAAAGADGGDFSAVAIAVGLKRTFNLLPSQRATSYLGAGLVWLQEVDIDFDTPSGEASFSDSAIGYQLQAGVRYQLAPRWEAGLELRYLDAGSLSLDGEGTASGSIDADYERTSLLGSLRYRF